jgi:acetate kinase
MTPPILAVNCGSSSIKFALFETTASGVERTAAWQGQVEGIGRASPVLEQAGAAPEALTPGTDHPLRDALEAVRARAHERLAGRTPMAVAHRVVHGGTVYARPVRIDTAVLENLRRFIPLAPLHQPFALEAIDAWQRADPALPQVAAFDTAFHATMPEVEHTLPLPLDLRGRGLRRYGFHGLSYEYLAIALRERHGARAEGRVIAAHLGSGASLCAMHGLASVATTMGFSALDGLMMGTRCGALDPGVLLHLIEVERMAAAEVSRLLYHRSGLLGVSGVSSDPRVLLAAEAGDAHVRLALAMYVRRIVREIGALTAVLGGLDLLVFTAGIGEHNAEIRRRVCEALGFLGAVLDAPANAAHAPIVSAPSSRLCIGVEPTDEAWIAARHAFDLIAGGRA